jgi:hypothetical protein
MRPAYVRAFFLCLVSLTIAAAQDLSETPKKGKVEKQAGLVWVAPDNAT